MRAAWSPVAGLSAPWAGSRSSLTGVKGAYAWDVDGNATSITIGSWGPAICGHAHPEVIAAPHQALAKGTKLLAPPCALENRLAGTGESKAVPSVEMVRFVNLRQTKPAFGAAG